MKYNFYYWLLIMTCTFSKPLHAQDLKSQLSQYREDNAKQYMRPMTNLLGITINSSFYHTAYIPPTGFHLNLKLITTKAPIGETRKTFQAVTEITPTSINETSTVFGKKEGTVIPNYTYPGGLDLSAFQINMLQLDISSVVGTELIIRFLNRSLAKSLNRDLPQGLNNFKLLGLGVRHMMNRYIPDTPINVTLGYYLHVFRLDDYLRTESIFLGIQGSYTYLLWTLYGGVAIESTRSTLNYQFVRGNITENQYFELRGHHPFSMTIGLSMDLFIINCYIEYKITTQEILSAGAGIGF